MDIIKDNICQYYTFIPGVGLVLISGKTYKYIGNFNPMVKSRSTTSINSENIQYVTVYTEFEDGSKSETKTVNIKNIDKIDWVNDFDLRCELNPELRNANKHIANIIRAYYHNAPMETTKLIDRLGLHFINEIPVFCIGDRLIWPIDKQNQPNVVFKPLQYRLAIDPNITEQEADAGMMKILNLYPEITRILHAHNLVYIMYEAFIATGITPRICIFLYGTTGFKKTTIAAFITQLYNRDNGIEQLVRLNASIPAAVRLLYEKNNCVIGLDDLFLSQSKEITKQQKNTMCEITRVVADGVEPARMRGFKIAKARPKCGVLFTGEFFIGTGSDAARLLPVEMITPLDNEKLTECQNEPLLLSTHYDYFIKWYVNKYNEICDLMKEWKTAYRSVKSSIHPRLQETQFCLEAAYKLYLTYREEKGFIAQENTIDEYNSYYHKLRNTVTGQNARVNQIMSSEQQKIDYFTVIRSMYLDRCFKLAEKIKSYDKDKHDGLVHKDKLYLRKEKLMAKVRILYPAADFDEILKCLKAYDALKPGKDSNSRQIHGVGRGLRFYAIKLGLLR